MFKELLLSISTFITEKLSNHPEVGIGGAAVTVVASPIPTLQLIGMVLGIIIAVLTLIIKSIELFSKIKKLKANKNITDNASDDDDSAT